jgi:orotate phosphoribosyltransferase
MIDDNAFQKQKDALIQLILDSHCYDDQKKFVNLDYLWSNPKSFDTSVDLITSLIDTLIPLDGVSTLIGVDNVSFPFGLIPIVSAVSYYKKKPLAILKESDNPLLSSHNLYGDRTKNDSLVIYDVTRYGMTSNRLINFIFDQGICPRAFLTIVDHEKNAKELIMSPNSSDEKKKMEFYSILTITEINNAFLQRQ